MGKRQQSDRRSYRQQVFPIPMLMGLEHEQGLHCVLTSYESNTGSRGHQWWCGQMCNTIRQTCSSHPASQGNHTSSCLLLPSPRKVIVLLAELHAEPAATKTPGGEEKPQR